MVAWEKPLGALCPALETQAVLTACCRGRTGMLADDGARWAVLILPGGGYRRMAPAESEPEPPQQASPPPQASIPPQASQGAGGGTEQGDANGNEETAE